MTTAIAERGATAELVVRAVHALRRSGIWWTVGIAAYAVLNAAVWPSLEGTDALSSFEDMGEILEAFGAEDLTTAAGYLDGQTYALMLPLLFSGMAIAAVTAITSGDEDAGRLELVHALPVSRAVVWLGRFAGAMVVLVAVSAVTTVVMVLALPVFSLDEVGASRIAAATFACAALAAFHASVGYLAGGLGASRGLSVGIAVLVLLVGYVLNFLVPLAEGLDGARRASPWHWAIGTQPVSDGVGAGGLLLVLAAAAALVAWGTVAVGRRDIRSA